MKNKLDIVAAGSAALFGAFALCGSAVAQDKSDDKKVETSVVTNDNGTVTRMYKETSVSRNGDAETRKIRITMTNLDNDGNVIGTTTKEGTTCKTGTWSVLGEDPAVSSASDALRAFMDAGMGFFDDGEDFRVFTFPGSSAMHLRRMKHGGAPEAGGIFVLDESVKLCGGEETCEEEKADAKAEAEAGEEKPFSFLGVKLGVPLAECGATNPVNADPNELKDIYAEKLRKCGCIRYVVTPPNALNGFNVYEVWVTPKTKTVVAIAATVTSEMAKNDVVRNYDYLEKALERKYGKPSLKEGSTSWAFDKANSRIDDPRASFRAGIIPRHRQRMLANRKPFNEAFAKFNEDCVTKLDLRLHSNNMPVRISVFSCGPRWETAKKECEELASEARSASRKAAADRLEEAVNAF